MNQRAYHHGDLKNALIQAGTELLAEQGPSGLSLRRVAERVGVSHAAPYAHFPDKQALIAAIATQGFQQLWEQLDVAVSQHRRQPHQQLVSLSKAYARFALDRTTTFQLMFSGDLGKQGDYPELTEITQKLAGQVTSLVTQCLGSRAAQAGTADLTRVLLWGQVHGMVQLFLANQIPSGLLKSYSLEDLVETGVRRALLAAAETL
jgi:AcrR family transcriptional regulator